MNPNEMLLVIPHSLLTSETIGGDIHGVSLKKGHMKIVLKSTLRNVFSLICYVLFINLINNKWFYQYTYV